MKFRVVLIPSEEGFAASVPTLPGCCSQGTTELEAMENIADAIREYLEVREELLRGEAGARIREVEVAV
jgi:predicted RNase H-like HicB family nuclease